jgi:hypothetical protein
MKSEYGAKWFDIGRLRFIWCAAKPPSVHPNVWMIVWRRKLPAWAGPRSKWLGSDTPGPYWKGCTARLERARGVAQEDAVCRFPKCDCWHRLPEERRGEWDQRREEWERRRAEGAAYTEEWKRKLREQQDTARGR